MASRTDVRDRMISAGEDLLSHRGYGVTMLDVIARADAPRGSIYYHFPHGKQELAIEVVRKVHRELEGFVAHVAARTADPVEFLQRLVEHHRKRLVSSGYELGCPLMGIVASGEEVSAELDSAVADAFAAWSGAVAAGLKDKGVAAPAAARLASVVVTGIEGCIVVARARRSGQPFTDLGRSIPTTVAAIVGGSA